MDRVGASKGIECLISTKSARITVRHATQRGVKMILHSSLSYLCKTNDRALRYNRLQHNLFTDTVQSGTVSSGGNRYAHIYLTEFGWSIAHPMKKK